MTWPYIAAFTLAAFGAVGCCLMIAAFVLIARQGGWKQAIQQPIATGRWPLARRLLLVGAVLGTIFAIGIFIPGLIPGGIPWVKPPVNQQSIKRLNSEDGKRPASARILDLTNRMNFQT